jgi:hypothetical protein
VHAVAGDLSVLRVERERARVVVGALEVDLAAGSTKLLQRVLRRAGTAPAAIQVSARRRRELAESTPSVEPGRSTTFWVPSSVRATWRDHASDAPG